MTIQCPICKKYLDIGASVPRQALETHVKKFHPDQYNIVKKEQGQSLATLVNNVKNQIKINIGANDEKKPESESETESGNVQPGGSDGCVDPENAGRETIPTQPKLSGFPEYKSKHFSRKATYHKK